MIIVGLTGGIGSGKTTVARHFEALGVPVYIADDEAKKLMGTSEVIKKELIDLFGKEAYTSNSLNKPFIAEKIFGNKELLEKMNAIVHPEVVDHFNKWVENQNSKYVIKETAILFETKGFDACDYVITVVTPKDVRIKRLLQRNNTTEKGIEAVMNNQWSDDDKIKHSHFVITNLDLQSTTNQVEDIHREILNKIG